MFSKSISHNEKQNNEINGFLDKGTKFEGKLAFEGTVRIKGDFKGEIFTKDTLVIEIEAQVEANIEAANVIINGNFSGSIFATESVFMHPPARFRGTVTSPCLRIDEGVIFEGASFFPEDKKSTTKNVARLQEDLSF